MSEIVLGPDNPIVDFHLHNHYDNGWYFGSGDPEFWQLSDRMLKPGGKLLDIGIGEGRSSLYFALNGMEVTGVESNPERVEATNEMSAELARSMPFKMEALQLDALSEPLPPGQFDTILIGHLVHLGSKQEAYNLFDKALASLKLGGHIWVRGAGKESFGFIEAAYYAESMWQPSYRFIDRDVIEFPCTCSGEYKIEPTLFFDPLDLHVYFAQKGCNVIHSQTIPTKNKMNIMYGEDYNNEQDIPIGGMITVLAQKPQSLN